MSAVPLEGAPVRLGEKIGRRIRYTREQISHFARLTLDENPLHHDLEAAREASFGEVIAAGQQTSSVMMGLVATHFSRRDDGIAREMLCLNFNFSYKLPVFAEQEVELSWTVSSIETNRKLAGLLVHLDGVAMLPGRRVAVIGRGTILLRETGASSVGLPQPPTGATLDVVL